MNVLHTVLLDANGQSTILARVPGAFSKTSHQVIAPPLSTILVRATWNRAGNCSPVLGFSLTGLDKSALCTPLSLSVDGVRVTYKEASPAATVSRLPLATTSSRSLTFLRSRNVDGQSRDHTTLSCYGMLICPEDRSREFLLPHSAPGCRSRSKNLRLPSLSISLFPSARDRTSRRVLGVLLRHPTCWRSRVPSFETRGAGTAVHFPFFTFILRPASR